MDHGLHKELDAAESCFSILIDLPHEARNRVMSYLANKFISVENNKRQSIMDVQYPGKNTEQPKKITG